MIKKFLHWKIADQSFSFFQVTLIITLLFVTTLRAEAFDFRIDGISYDITSSSTCKVVSGEQVYKGAIRIPSEVSFNSLTYKVTAIGNKAFFNCEELTDIGLPESLEVIEADAFSNCIALTSLNIPDNIKNVNKTSFMGANLQELYIGDCVNQIGMAAFYFVPSVHLTSSITKINDVAFEDADGLINIYIPNSIKEIEANAFAFCGNLQRVYIDDLANWCEIKFGNQYANPTSKAGEIWVNGNHLTYLEIPDGVRSINDYAFYGCKYIYELKLPDSVERIEQYSFQGCDRLSTLRFGKGLRYIGFQAIRGNNISKVYTNDIDSFCQIDIEDYIFHQLYISELFCDGKLVTKINLSDGVEHIGKNVFCNYGKLSSISMPNSVTSIGESAFFCCTGLVKAILSDSIRILPRNCFGGAVSLSNLHLPCGLKTVEENAFADIAVPKIVLPFSTENIGKQAFRNCKADTIVLSDNIRELKEWTFSDCYNLKYVDLGKSMERIDGSCFYDCRSLSSLNLPASMESLNMGWPDYTNFSDLFCNSTDPYEAYFSQSLLQQTTLHVPLGCRDKFLADYQWSGFKEIVEMDGLGAVDEITHEISRTLPVDVYDYNGKWISNSLGDLPAGIYIIKQGKHTKKIVVN